MQPHPLHGLDPSSHELPLDTPAWTRTAIAMVMRPIHPAPVPLGSLATHLASLEHASLPFAHAPQAFATPPASLAPGGAPILYSAPPAPHAPLIDMGTLHTVRMWQCWRIARALVQKRVAGNPLPAPGQPPYRAAYTDPAVALEWLGARPGRMAGWFVPSQHPAQQDAASDALERGRALLAGAAEPLPPNTPLTIAEARCRLLRAIPMELDPQKSFLRAAHAQLATLLPPPAPRDPDNASTVHFAYQAYQDNLLIAYTQLVQEVSIALRVFYPTSIHRQWALWSTCGLTRPQLARAAWSTADELQATELAFSAWQIEQAQAFTTVLKQHEYLATTFGSTPTEIMTLVQAGRDTNQMVHQRTRVDKEIETSAQLLEVASKANEDGALRLRALTEKARVEGLTEKRTFNDADAEDLIKVMLEQQRRLDEQRSTAPQIEQKALKTIDILPAKQNSPHLTPDQRRARWADVLEKGEQ